MASARNRGARERLKGAADGLGLLPAARGAREAARAVSTRLRDTLSAPRRRSRTKAFLREDSSLVTVTVRTPSAASVLRREVIATVRSEPSARAARHGNLELVQRVLTAAGIGFVELPVESAELTRVGIRSKDTARVIQAMAQSGGPTAYAGFEGYGIEAADQFHHVATTNPTRLESLARRAKRWGFFEHRASPDGRDVFGAQLMCEIDPWIPVGSRFSSEKANLLVSSLSASDFTTDARPIELAADHLPRLISTVAFPIDVVYTWVDGDDPRWQARREATLSPNTADDHHPEAASDARYASRDELRYSLRSIEKYADFVNHVYLVTDGQRPDWLRDDHPRLTIVDHRDIFEDHSALPTFNSHAIESRLHHIPGLSEHYIYMNDDFLFTRRVSANRFFLGNGLAYFFASTAMMPLGDPTPDTKPVDSAAMNGRRLVSDRLGVTPTHKMKHAPYPQRRSVHLTIEEMFPDDVHRTMHSRVRNPSDLAIASSLHHHVGYALGLAVPGRIASMYTDLGTGQLATELDDLLTNRTYETLCLNDTDSADISREEKDRLVADFLRTLFPEPSSFEIS